MSTKRASVFLVTLGAQATAAAITWVALPFTGHGPSGQALVWGVIAGCGAWLGTIFLYRGLARGRMSVVGPLSAVFAAAGSAIVGVLLGERPTALEVVGVVAACVAIGLVSAGAEGHPPGDRARAIRGGVLDGAGAGAGFAVLFVGLNRAGDGAGLWPVAFSESAGVALAAALSLVVLLRGNLGGGVLARAMWLGAVPAGALGGAATIAYFYATQLGLLTISAVIASLYPAATVALAVLVLRERLRPLQGVGLVLAAVSVGLLASRI